MVVGRFGGKAEPNQERDDVREPVEGELPVIAPSWRRQPGKAFTLDEPVSRKSFHC